jgi:hypothetical protein
MVNDKSEYALLRIPQSRARVYWMSVSAWSRTLVRHFRLLGATGRTLGFQLFKRLTNGETPRFVTYRLLEPSVRITLDEL